MNDKETQAVNFLYKNKINILSKPTADFYKFYKSYLLDKTIKFYDEKMFKTKKRKN